MSGNSESKFALNFREVHLCTGASSWEIVLALGREQLALGVLEKVHRAFSGPAGVEEGVAELVGRWVNRGVHGRIDTGLPGPLVVLEGEGRADGVGVNGREERMRGCFLSKAHHLSNPTLGMRRDEVTPRLVATAGDMTVNRRTCWL